MSFPVVAFRDVRELEGIKSLEKEFVVSIDGALCV